MVVVRRSEVMHDIAAGTFTQQFYFALVNGKTVQQAFDIARQSIDSIFAHNNYLADESRKFVLLPRDADHNVRLFDALEEEKDCVVVDHTPKRGTATSTSCRTG